jgi:transcriptional regulator with XRE-family HTH domain
MQRLSTFCDTLKELMEVKGYNVSFIENATGISNSRIYDYLNRRHLPDLQSAIKIAHLFQCPLDFLFGFIEDYEPKTFTYNVSVNGRVKDVIDKTKLSHYRIAQKTGLTEAQLSYWYHNKKTPTLTSLVILAEHLECSLDYLAGKD